MLSRLIENLSPNRSKFVQPQIRPLLSSFSLAYRFFPIQMTFVFSVFILSQEKDPNSSKVLRAAIKEDCEPSKKSVVSSAYSVILNSVPLKKLPLISGFYIMSLVKISAVSIKR